MLSRLSRVLDAIAPQGFVGQRRRRLQWEGGVLVITAFALFLYSDHRSHERCGQDCYGAPPQDGYGSVTYEPGHTWTSYADSWQWWVQHGLTQLALLASIIGLGLTFAERNPVKLYVLAIAALLSWIVWVPASPAPN